jgi:hypothetical protein
MTRRAADLRRRPALVVTARAVALAVLVGAACRVKQRPNDEITRIDRLSLERLECGPCPNYTVTLTSDGKVTFLGGRNVTTSDARGVASVAQIAKIVAAVNGAHFSALKDQYATEADGCPGLGTDWPTARISVTVGLSTKSITHYQGCRQPSPVEPPPQVTPSGLPLPPPPFAPSPPPDLGCAFPLALTILENEIDDILGTEIWVGHPRERLPMCEPRIAHK